MELTYNGIDLTDMYFRLIEIEEEVLPVMTNDILRKPNGRGTFITRKSLDARRIKLIGRVMAPDRETLNERLQDLAGVLLNGSLSDNAILQLPDRQYYYYAVLESNSPITPFMRSGDVEIDFYCADPYSYGSITTVDIPDNVNVFCNATVKPKIEVKFTKSASQYIVTNSDTGEHVTIVHDFVANDKLVIDFVEESVKKNGVLIMADVVYTSDFFELKTGVTAIASTEDGILSYIERWAF